MIASPRMVVRRPSFAAAGAMVCAALALWLSAGALSFVDTDGRAAYVGLLPPVAWLAGLVAAACLLTVLVRPSARAVAPLWLSSVLILPWLPFRLPLSVFVWTDHVALWLWTAIATALVVPRLAATLRRSGRVFSMSPPKAALLAGVLSLAISGLGAWAVAPQHPNGDEPHYLIITQSLLADRDLQIENNHRQRDYRAYSKVGLKPDFLRRGTSGAIYSIHAPGLPFLVSPFFAAFGYHGVVAALVAFGALASALAWLVAWRVTHNVAASWFGWAAVTLSVPYFFLAGSVFPDAPGAVLTLGAALPLVDERARQPRWLIAVGAALAVLPWLHTRFAVLAACGAAAIIGRLLGEPDRAKRIAALIACPVVSAIAWLSFFQIIYGTPNPSVVYNGATNIAVGNIARGGLGVLVDQQFGLLTTAPVFLCAFAGLATMLWRGPRRLAIELLLITMPYFLSVTSFYMWWAGTSTPARFLVPIVLLLVIPTAMWYAQTKSVAARTFGGCTLLVSLLVTATIATVSSGAYVFNFRDGASRLALWLSPVVDLTRALPSLFQNPPATVALQAGIWLSAMVGAIAIARLFVQRRSSSAVVVLGLALEVAAMAAVSLVWRSNHVAAATPSSGSTAVLRRYAPGSRQLAIAYRPFRRVPLDELPGSMLLARTLSTHDRGDWSEMTHLPPAVYEISGRVVGSPAGHVRVMTDRRSPAIADWDVALLDPSWKRDLLIPVAVEGLRVDLDAAARGSVRDLVVRAVSVVPQRDRPAGDREAGHAARYGPAVVFSLGGTSWVEPGGIWVGGAADADFVIEPDQPSTVRLFVRNGATDNEVTLVGGFWRKELALKAGEERIVDIPADPRRLGTPLRVSAAHGFRPSAVNPKTDDDRFLGVWIETR